jgi:hypothetical protein
MQFQAGKVTKQLRQSSSRFSENNNLYKFANVFPAGEYIVTAEYCGREMKRSPILSWCRE